MERDPRVVYIKEIASRSQLLKETLNEHVDAMCELLFNEVTSKHDIHEDVLESSKENLTDIYRSLKLHLYFHVGENAVTEHERLKALGRDHLKLDEKELNQFPETVISIKHAIDPGTKFLEVLRDITPESPECPRDSESHANKVIKKAKEAFTKHLKKIRKKRNIFKPKVLALVKRGEKCSVGSSMAVSNCLRPFCLHNRIHHFKQSLKKAVISDEPLSPPAEAAMAWSSSAFNCGNYQNSKYPCQKCQNVFQNLPGFITNNGFLENAGGDNNFLGACAEYVPANHLLQDDGYIFSEDDKEKMNTHRAQCESYFWGYRDITSKCQLAYKRFLESKDADLKYLVNVYDEIRSKIHIFGFKPECRLGIP